MTTWILKKINAPKAFPILDTVPASYPNGISLFCLLLASFLLIQRYDAILFDIIVSTLSDAYLGVSIFVALTLAGFYSLDRCLGADLTRILNDRSMVQVPMASFLGALPGCGGAIIVVTQFVNGRLSFGALVAVLVSTMGDAAFLLISRKPSIALLVYGISLAAGILFGYVVNWIHGHNFMKTESSDRHEGPRDFPRLPSLMVKSFLVLLVPAALIGILEACQIEVNQFFGGLAHLDPIKWLGFIGALLCIVVWICQPLDSWSARFAEKSEIKYLQETIVAETSFVSVWVILGFLSYELLVHFTGLDFREPFLALGPYGILLAIVIGFVPGCGPQIVVTTLYLNGVVPLSAQLANAISNDGDALFPAIALAPRVAIIATIYSAIPAFLIGYVTLALGW